MRRIALCLGLGLAACASLGLAVSPATTPTPGDVDLDGDLDWEDYSIFEVCLSISGPDQLPAFEECNDRFDFDGDDDVDLADAGKLLEAFTGPRVPMTIPAKTYTLDLIGVHDTGSEFFDPECIECHSDRVYEVALDGVTPTAHAQMIGVMGAGNGICRGCHHQGGDFVSQSAANLRKQVDLVGLLCTECHNEGEGAPGIPAFFSRPHE